VRIYVFEFRLNDQNVKKGEWFEKCGSVRDKVECSKHGVENAFGRSLQRRSNRTKLLLHHDTRQQNLLQNVAASPPRVPERPKADTVLLVTPIPLSAVSFRV
jgi:hypothetical protein